MVLYKINTEFITVLISCHRALVNSLSFCLLTRPVARVLSLIRGQTSVSHSYTRFYQRGQNATLFCRSTADGSELTNRLYPLLVPLEVFSASLLHESQ